jgi:hypothetical protein
VYDIVKNKDNPGMAILNMLLGAAGGRGKLKSGENYSNAASKRWELGVEDVGKFDAVFKRYDDGLRKIIPADRCKV